MLLSQISAYTIHGKIQKVIKNKFKISTSMWNETFNLPDGSYSVSHIQVILDGYILTYKWGEKSNNPSIRI